MSFYCLQLSYDYKKNWLIASRVADYVYYKYEKSFIICPINCYEEEFPLSTT